MKQRNNPYYLILFMSVFFLVGSVIYNYGFTSSSTTSSFHSPKANPYAKEMQYKNAAQKAIYEKQWFPTQSSEVMFMIVDSLPYYYVVNEEEQQLKAKRAREGDNDPSLKIPSRDIPFKQFLDSLNEDPDNTVLMKAFSHPPTYTTLRIKAMLQGILPSYDQLTSNLGSKELKFDSIFSQAKVNNPFTGEQKGKVLCYGSHFINQLYPHTFDRGRFVGEIQFYEREKHDIEQYQIIEKEQMVNDDWSAMLIHFDGIDAASHLADSLDDVFLNTIEAVNQLVRNIIQNIKNSPVNTDQTIIIASDHGINYEVNGHHGGYTALESNTVMFGYSKHQFITKDKKDIGQNMDREFLAAPDVFQIHATPTYCMLLGIPIPANNLGMISPDFFLDKPEVDDFVIANNFYTNFRQVEDGFQEKIKDFTGELTSITEINSLSIKIKAKYNSLFQGDEDSERTVDPQNLKEFVQLCQQYSIDIVAAISRDLQGTKIEYMWFGLFVHFALAVFIFMVVAAFRTFSYKNEFQLETIFPQTSSVIWKSIISLIAFVSISIVLGFFIMFRNLMIFEGIFCIVVLVLMCVINASFIKSTFKPSLEMIRHNITVERVLEWSIFLVSVGFYLLMRTSNDYFDFSIDIFGVYFQIISVFFGVLLFIKKRREEIETTAEVIKIVAKIVSVPILLFICNYYNVNAKSKYNTPPPFWSSLISAPVFKNYIPLAIYLSFFSVMFIRIGKKIFAQSTNSPLKVLFVYLHTAQLGSVTLYYLSQWNLVKIANSPTILPAAALFHTIFIEMIKCFLFKKEILPKISESLKTVYFLTSTAAGCACVLEWNSLIQVPIFFTVCYLILSTLVSLRAVTLLSTASILFYLSQFFFQLSGHLEYLEEIHADVFQVGVIYEQSLIIPIFNGVVNTLYYYMVTPAIIPIFVDFMLSDAEKKRSYGVFKSIFNAIVHKYEEEKEQLESAPKSATNFYENFCDDIEGGESSQSAKSNPDKELKSQEYTYSVINSLISIAFISHILIGVIGCDIRNLVKPMDSNKENMYVPNYMFQIAYAMVYFTVISINQLFSKRYQHIQPTSASNLDNSIEQKIIQ